MTRREAPSDAVPAFFDEVVELMGAGDPRMTLLGPHESAAEHLSAYESDPQRRAWNMQLHLVVQQLRAYARLNAESRSHGTDMRLVVPRRTLRRSPLFLGLEDPVRVGTVVRPMLVVDASAFFSGPPGTDLADTFWQTLDPGIVARAAEIFLLVWDAAVPAAAVDPRPPLPDRTVQVALLLVDGASDRDIAVELGVSERTVSAEVHRIVRWLGARSRGHAIAMLVGAG